MSPSFILICPYSCLSHLLRMPLFPISIQPQQPNFAISRNLCHSVRKRRGPHCFEKGSCQARIESSPALLQVPPKSLFPQITNSIILNPRILEPPKPCTPTPSLKFMLSSILNPRVESRNSNIKTLVIPQPPARDHSKSLPILLPETLIPKP